MTDNDRGQAVTVSCRECRCPGTPGAYHERDEVYLAPEPGLRLAMKAQMRIQAAMTQSGATVDFDTEAATLDLMEVFVTYGVTGWNLVDEGGMLRELDTAEILADMSLSYPVADRASELYLKKVTDPLVGRLAAISATGPTGASRSVRRASTGKRHARSSPVGSAASGKSMP